MGFLWLLGGQASLVLRNTEEKKWQVSELETQFLGWGPLKGLFCSCSSTGACQGHMTFPVLLLMLWVSFKEGLGMKTLTQPPPSGLDDQPLWAEPVTGSSVMERWLLCTWGQARASRRGYTWPVPPREAKFPVGVEGPDPSSPCPCGSF